MGKKRRDGKAKKRGDPASSNAAARNSRIETVHLGNGDVYEGEMKDGRGHGKGVFRYGNGDVYDGELKEGKRQGRGIYKYKEGTVYEGEWVDGWTHGWGTTTRPGRDVHEGSYVHGMAHGKGTMKYVSNGNVYEGDFVNGRRHGWGTLKCTSGKVYEGKWVEGNWQGEGILVDGDGMGQLSSSNNITDNTISLPNRKLRSQRSQQRRLEADKKACEHCGLDDYRYKLRVCSACNLALYCSADCQKAASRSHRGICDIISMLPSRDSDRLVLQYDKEKLVDLDAGLCYATKYMENLKHLAIGLEKVAEGDSVKFSVQPLSSLLRSKKDALDTVFWSQNRCTNANKVLDAWKEMHGLKQLRLERTSFDDVQPLHDIIRQQKNSLMVLCLPFLEIDWHRAKSRRTIAQAVSSCKHLVKLDLRLCTLTDSDMKIMLQDLPSLRIFHLDGNNSHQFSDNTCGLIARKCPGLQLLNLHNHNQLSVRGIRKIFEGCPHLRSFVTSSCKMSCNDMQDLLDIAPQLLHLAFDGDTTCFSNGEVDKIIEATGGRTVLRFGLGPSLVCLGGAFRLYEPHGGVSSEARDKYDRQNNVILDIWASQNDPEVANEWAGLLEG